MLFYILLFLLLSKLHENKKKDMYNSVSFIRTLLFSNKEKDLRLIICYMSERIM